MIRRFGFLLAGLLLVVVLGVAGTIVLDARPIDASPPASPVASSAAEAESAADRSGRASGSPQRSAGSARSSSAPNAAASGVTEEPKDRAAATDLARAMDRLLADGRADDAFWGALVRDLQTGEVLYSRNADKAFLPASNQKIITTAAALDLLGSTYRYETTLRFDGQTVDSVMTGDLVIDGSGDPTFGSVELRGADPLQTWAERLADMGVRRIEGRLIGDDNRFDDRPYPEGWDVDYITRQAGRYMGTSASGLSYSDNVVAVKISAARPGAPPNVRLRPAGTVNVRNEARTSSRWRGSSVQVDRIFTGNTVHLTGTVARSYRGTVNVPVSNPTMFTLQSFVQELQAAGIETDLDVRDIDDVSQRPDDGKALFVDFSPPLSEIIAVVNKRSNNFYAEQLFRTYGWGGSARGASKRTNAFLRQIGVNTRQLLVNDGSGLSRKDLMTPRAMVEVLAHMSDHPEKSAWFASLPQGGENNTTLEYRLHRTPVQAKTGSLRFVRALSGYAERSDGRRIAFAFFANNYTGPSYRVTRTMDDLVRTLAE